MAVRKKTRKSAPDPVNEVKTDEVKAQDRIVLVTANGEWFENGLIRLRILSCEF